MPAAHYAPGELLQTGLLLVVAVIILALGLWLVRRWWLKGRGKQAVPGEVWSLQDLREMRAAGQITEAEFATLKERLIAEFKAGAAIPDAANSPRDRRIPPEPG